MATGRGVSNGLRCAAGQQWAPYSRTFHAEPFRTAKQNCGVLMAECDPPRISKMLRSLFPDDESALELTLVSTISILLPTIQLVGPEVLFLDLAASGQDAMATVRACNRAAPSPALDYAGASAEKEIAEQSVKEGRWISLQRALRQHPLQRSHIGGYVFQKQNPARLPSRFAPRSPSAGRCSVIKGRLGAARCTARTVAIASCRDAARSRKSTSVQPVGSWKKNGNRRDQRQFQRRFIVRKSDRSIFEMRGDRIRHHTAILFCRSKRLRVKRPL